MPKTLTTGKAIVGIVLSIVLLFLAQGLSSLIYLAPISRMVSPIIFAVLYVMLSYVGAKIISEKILKLCLNESRITRFGLSWKWVVVSLLLPLIVSAILLCTPGKFVVNEIPAIQVIETLITAIFVTGIGVGIAEEIIFRGLMMHSFEKRWGKVVAIVVPSVFFGLLHAIGANLQMVDLLLLFIGGTSVGIMFSLIVYVSGSIWSSAMVHGIWNIIIIGNILKIGKSNHDGAIMSYTLLSKSALLTGGSFGVEVSIIAILGYISVITILLLNGACHRSPNKRKKSHS
ncbi:lysostaphin resistance A-like protein [Pseudoneobacillus sp. C159]